MLQLCYLMPIFLVSIELKICDSQYRHSFFVYRELTLPFYIWPDSDVELVADSLGLIGKSKETLSV